MVSKPEKSCLHVHLTSKSKLLTGTDLLGLEGGVPNGDPGLLFSLLVSAIQREYDACSVITFDYSEVNFPYYSCASGILQN